MRQSVSGFCYLCSLLEDIYQDKDDKQFFMAHMQNKTPMSKKDALKIMDDLATLARKVDKQHPGRSKMLTDVLNRYLAGKDEHIMTDLLCGDTKHIKNAFEGLFVKQNSVRNEIFACLAWVITMAAGVTEVPFYVGEDEIRRLLRKSLSCLGFDGIDFIPENCFCITGEAMDDNMLKLLVLSLYGSMKVQAPYKNPEKQREINYNRGRIAIQSLIRDNRDSLILSRVEYAGEASRICEGIRCSVLELAQMEMLPDQTSICVDKFYTFPLFEPDEAKSCCNQYFLQKDLGAGVRSVIIGDQGSGKTLLTKVATLACMDHPEKRSAFACFCANQMGLGNNRYEVLILDCSMLSRDFEAKGQDLIAEALDQTVHRAARTKYAGHLVHWSECRSQVLSYYTYLAKQSEILLIVENLSALKDMKQEMIVRCLEAYDQPGSNQASKINLLVTTRRLPRSVMNRFSGFNRIQIASLPVKETICRMVNAGLGCHDADWYMKLNDNDWMLQEYLNSSPEHLIRLLCEFDGQKLDVDVLIQRIIQDRLEQAATEGATAEACEALLTALAVALVEKHELGRSQEVSPCGSRSRFRKSCIGAPVFQNLPGDRNETEFVWQHIQDQQLLLSHGVISNYQFSCRLFACSLVADHYLELLTSGPQVNWLERFNRIHAEDMAAIARMMLVRSFCSGDSLSEISRSNRSYSLQLFLQSVAAYMVSRRSVQEVFPLLRTLSDILYDSRMEAWFLNSHLAPMWDMLHRVYWERYDYYGNCWGMDVSGLRKPAINIPVKA